MVNFNKPEIEQITRASQELLDAFGIVYLILVGPAVLQEGTLEDAAHEAESAAARLSGLLRLKKAKVR